MSNLTPAQEEIVDIINGRTCIGTFELEVIYVGQGEDSMSITVSEEDEDEEDEVDEDVVYYNFSVRKAVESCIAGHEIDHGFIIVGVDGYTREQLLAIEP